MTVEDSARADRLLYTGSGALTVVPGEVLPMHVVFGAQGSETVDVVVPFAGLAADVPVVDLEDLAGFDGGEEQAEVVQAAFDGLVSDPGAVSVSVADLASFQVSIGGGVDTEVTPEQVLINVSADVLFEVDQAAVTADADAALRSAVGQFAGYSAGSLTVVGHTDDVGEVDYNQDLSLRRAQAVADYLGSLTDLSGFTVQVEGRGESEPRAAGTSAEERKLNRRVELVFVPEGDQAAGPGADPGFALPDSEGPTGTGAEGVVVSTKDGGQVRVSLGEVRRRGGLLVGEVHLDHVAGIVKYPGEMLSHASWNARGEFEPSQMLTPSNLALVWGDQRFFPVDYLPAGSDVTDPRLPVTERIMRDPITEGGGYTATVVWPVAAAGPEGTEVTLDVFNPRADPTYRSIRPPFRLTDIPVTN